MLLVFFKSFVLFSTPYVLNMCTPYLSVQREFLCIAADIYIMFVSSWLTIKFYESLEGPNKENKKRK